MFSLSGAAGFTILFDYSTDTTNDFFASGSDARSTLEAAGAFYESILSDTFSVIDASAPGDTWSPNYFHPETGDHRVGAVFR